MASLQAVNLQTVIRGHLLLPRPDRPGLEELIDGLVEIQPDGRIRSVSPAPPGSDIPVTWPGTVLLPGFVDTHVHFPQTRILGSASGPLLPWLQASVFPEEARFADASYAEAVAREFTGAMLRQGTVAASIFSSSHEGATDALFAELKRRGLSARVGLTLMNRGAPDAVLKGTEAAMASCEALIRRWHGADDGRLTFCVTPRFALSCDEGMLRAAGALAARHGLWIQTHLSENPDELEATRQAFPDAVDYLDVYDRFGLVGERSIFAHAIHLSPRELGRLGEADARIAHCPDSNFFLGSGCMPLARTLEAGIKVGLGTDVGAGRSFSLPRIASSAYDASLLVGQAVPPDALLWLATRGGAVALGMGDRLGLMAPGYDADLVAVSIPPGLSGRALWDALLFHHDRGPVAATLLRGRRALE